MSRQSNRPIGSKRTTVNAINNNSTSTSTSTNYSRRSGNIVHLPGAFTITLARPMGEGDRYQSGDRLLISPNSLTIPGSPVLVELVSGDYAIADYCPDSMGGEWSEVVGVVLSVTRRRRTVAAMQGGEG